MFSPLHCVLSIIGNYSAWQGFWHGLLDPPTWQRGTSETLFWSHVEHSFPQSESTSKSFQDPHSHLVLNNYKTEGWAHNPTQDNDLSFPGFRMMSGDEDRRIWPEQRHGQGGTPYRRKQWSDIPSPRKWKQFILTVFLNYLRSCPNFIFLSVRTHEDKKYSMICWGNANQNHRGCHFTITRMAISEKNTGDGRCWWE